MVYNSRADERRGRRGHQLLKAMVGRRMFVSERKDSVSMYGRVYPCTWTKKGSSLKPCTNLSLPPSLPPSRPPSLPPCYLTEWQTRMPALELASTASKVRLSSLPSPLPPFLLRVLSPSPPSLPPLRHGLCQRVQKDLLRVPKGAQEASQLPWVPVRPLPPSLPPSLLAVVSSS